MISSLGLQTLNGSGSGGGGATGSIWEIHADAGLRPKILELSVICGAPAGVFVFGPAQRLGYNPVKVYFQPEDDTVNASRVWAAVSWNIPPDNLPLNNWNVASPFLLGTYWRRVSMGATAAGIVWAFPRGLTVPPGTSDVIYCTSGVVTAIVNCQIED